LAFSRWPSSSAHASEGAAMPLDYLIGITVAVALLAYLLYVLLNAEKF
jgi:K+-transporting ATPase KdpF subunit